MDWQNEVIILIEMHFKNLGISYKPQINAHRCLIDFFNLEMKLIKPLPRTLFKSLELKSRTIPFKYIKALSYIESKIKLGTEITWHQSKKTLDPSYNDLLLNNWVIQHLHLSDSKGQKGQKFYDRSKYLLFALFSQSQAFLIDIREHNEKSVFAKKELLEIIDNNWPQILNEDLNPDASFFNNDYSDEDRETLRKKGYSIPTTEVNGKIIINSGIGITTSGHNLHVVKRANAVVRYLHETIEEVEKNNRHLKEDLGVKDGNKLDLCIHRVKEWPFFAVYEKNSKCYIEKKYN